MHEARVMFEKRIVNKFVYNKDSSIFRYIHSLPSKPAIPSIVYFNSCKANSPLSIANLFNQYFHSVYNTRSFSHLDPPLSYPDKSICNIDISLQDTFEALTSLQTDKAMGGDGISPLILNKAGTAILEPLHHIFLLCIKQSSLVNGETTT